MLGCRDDVKRGTLDDLVQQPGDGAAVAERLGFAAERIDDPLDTSIHFHESKMANLCSQGCAAWT